MLRRIEMPEHRCFPSFHSRLRRKKPPEDGFTLIEIMVVIFIIALLAALVVPKIVGRTEEAKRTPACSCWARGEGWVS